MLTEVEETGKKLPPASKNEKAGGFDIHGVSPPTSGRSRFALGADALAAITRRDNGDRRAASRIEDARRQFGVELFDGPGCGDDGWQPGDIAMVDDLVELFARPGRGAFGAQVVQHEQRRSSDFLKAFVVAHGAGRIECCAEVIEQVRHNYKEHRVALVIPMIGDGRCQMRLAAAVGTGEQQPIARLGGKVLRQRERPIEVIGLFD